MTIGTYKQLWHLFFLTLLSLLLQSCASNTLTSSWTDQSFHGPIQGPILVIGVFKDPTAHKIFEDSFVSGLVNAGADAVPSYKYSSGTERHSKEWLQKTIQQSGATAILITHLSSEKKTIDYFAPKGVILGGGVYSNGVDGFHSYVVEDTLLPDEQKSKTVDYIVATIFDVTTGKAIWTGNSKDVNMNHMLRKDDQKIESLFITDMQHQHLL